MRTCVRVSVSRAGILHADLDAFFASVEQRDEPSLRGRPVIVGGGVVLAASYEAKAHGVRTAMGGRRGAAAMPARRSSSRRGCPPTRRRAGRSSRSSARRRRWSRASRSTRRSSTCAGSSTSRGRRARSPPRLRRSVLDEVGLPITVGVAATKFLAKVASARRQARRPARRPGRRGARFLHPLPIEGLWGVGAGHVGQAARRGDHDCRRAGRALSEAALVDVLGRASARHLHALAHNRDPRRVAGRAPPQLDRRAARARRPPQSPGGARRRADRRWSIASRAGCAARGASAARVTLRLRFGDFTRATRSHTLPEATAHTGEILATARDAARRRDAADRGARDHADRRDALEPRRRRRGPARAPGRRASRAALDARSTTSATATARRRSRARSC